MNEFNDEIRKALSEEHADMFNDDEVQQAHFESLKAMFRGQTKWFTILHLSTMVALLTMTVICAVQYFRVDSTRAMIAWSIGFAVCLILEALSELYFIMEWNKYVIRWEVKQLQLQVALLARGSQTQPESTNPTTHQNHHSADQ